MEKIPEGLYLQKGSKLYWTNVKRQRERTGTADLSEAIRILKIRQGRAAEGQPFIRRADTITCDEGFQDVREYYETTGKCNIEEAELRLKRVEK